MILFLFFPTGVDLLVQVRIIGNIMTFIEILRFSSEIKTDISLIEIKTFISP